ncbi:hypothetical protein PVAP13_3NG095679 [Panicum virgatum]|uniref:Uncharacterized protein n=1 Tax=Panicum virgatum TaxID=38727 RepID=A0A8T0U1X8_PANVG|nr:hypothetical protein PVAP13_3NG095679 [Panicum virgatum]
MAPAGHKSNATAAALLLLLLPLMLSSTVSEAARHPGHGKWEPPIIYPTPQTPWNPPIIYPSPIKPPPHSGGHLDMDLPSVDEQAPPALPERPADWSAAPRKP